jgi:hypothetical protein
MRICVRYLTRCRSIPRDVVIAIIAALCSNNIFVLYLCTAQLSLSFLTGEMQQHSTVSDVAKVQDSMASKGEKPRKTSKESGAS